MNQSTQKKIKEVIIDYLQDGEEHTIDEIKGAVERKGIVIEKGSSKLRTALYYLKQENSNVISVEKGVYKYKIDDYMTCLSNSKYDLSDFDHIGLSPRASSKLVMTVMSNGTVSLNGKLLECFVDGKAEIRLKADCSQIALIKNGEDKVTFGKNGRIKNYKLVDRITHKRKKFPVYYVGEWDAEEQIWLGKVSDSNPNIRKR